MSDFIVHFKESMSNLEGEFANVENTFQRLYAEMQDMGRDDIMEQCLLLLSQVKNTFEQIQNEPNKSK